MEKVRAVFKAGEKESFRRNKKESLSEKKKKTNPFSKAKRTVGNSWNFILGKHLKQHVLSVCLMA